MNCFPPTCVFLCHTIHFLRTSGVIALLSTLVAFVCGLFAGAPAASPANGYNRKFRQPLLKPSVGRAHGVRCAAGLPVVSWAMSNESITVRGARVHNLKNIDFEIPHNYMTVVTGVSGSGKSSLAFDTIYAEGQRRYVESLSAYARQFLERIEKPDVDVIDGIAPAVAIKQKNSTRNPRSTVATATEIFDYLRLLFARVGRTYCLLCGQEVKKDTVDEVVERLLGLGEGTRLNVFFPIVAQGAAPEDKSGKKSRGQKKSAESTLPSDAIKARLFDLRKRGFNRLFQNGQVFEFSTPESLLDVNFSEPVFGLVDRLVVAADQRSRIVDAVEIGYREAGEVIFETAVRDGDSGDPQRLR